MAIAVAATNATATANNTGQRPPPPPPQSSPTPTATATTLPPTPSILKQSVATRLVNAPVDCPWEWTVRALWSKNQAECAYVNILDTVTLDGGALENYLFTNNSGQVMRKAKRHVTLQRVQAEFLRIAKADAGVDETYGGDTGVPDDVPVCLAHKQDGGVEAMNAQAFMSMCKIGPGMDCAALQVHVSAKGGGEGIANFSHEYRLNSQGQPLTHAFKLGVDPDTIGATAAPMTQLPSMNRPVNDEMDKCATALVRTIERRRKVSGRPGLCVRLAVDRR